MSRVIAVLMLGMALGARGEEPPVPVLVELFTSEGCSSCPPADAALNEMVNSQPVAGVEIVALAFHVDYWDKLGWKDPFSDEAYTQRQYAYAVRWQSNRVYTPQMVVDGTDEFVGSDRGKARTAIGAGAKHEKAALTLSTTRAESELTVTVAQADGKSLDGALCVAVTESNLVTDVKRGENSGRTLRHDGVVRAWKRVDYVPDGKTEVRLTLPNDLVASNSRVVAFVQDERTGAVTALATAAVPEVE